MANEPLSPASAAYRAAIRQVVDGDFTTSIRALLELHERYPDIEEAYFVEEQLARVRRNWPVEAEKAGLTGEAWQALRERAVSRRRRAILRRGDRAVIALLLAAGAWCLAVTVGPRAAFLGRVDDVQLIFRIVSAVVGLVSVGTAFGFTKLKWEAVGAFVVLIPVIMVITFIGVTSSFQMRDGLAEVLTSVALAAEASAAWYVSRNAIRFIY